MQGKLLKAQFNKICLAGMELQLNKATIYGGKLGENLIEVSDSGVNIQAAMGGQIVLNTTQLRGPGFHYIQGPQDFLPLIRIFTPSKTIGPILEIKDMFSSIVQVGAYVKLLGGSA
jgi:hypothetical protein